MTREDRAKGFFVAFDYTSGALRASDALFPKCTLPVAVMKNTGKPRRAGTHAIQHGVRAFMGR